jgi:hypothetical protein
MLGAADAAAPPRGDSWISVAATLGGGALGSFLWKKHPVLGLLNGMALAGNAARMATKDITPRRAAENIGAHLVATASSLALPNYPIIGYLAGAAGSSFFLRRSDTYLERLDETILGARALVGATWSAAPTLAAVRGGLAQIKNGQRGDSVTYVQGMVGDSAYAPKGFTADGKFGDDTEGAVKKFQAAHSLAESGVVDQATIAAMDAISGGGGVSVIDMTKPDAPADGRPKKGWSQAQPGAMGPAITPDSPAGELTIFGYPAWKVGAAIAGAIGAGGIIYAGFAK